METGEKRKRRKWWVRERVLRGLVEMPPTTHYISHTLFTHPFFYKIVLFPINLELLTVIITISYSRLFTPPLPSHASSESPPPRGGPSHCTIFILSVFSHPKKKIHSSSSCNEISFIIKPNDYYDPRN